MTARLRAALILVARLLLRRSNRRQEREATLGSVMVMSGVDMRTIQELMGHKNDTNGPSIGASCSHHQLAAVQRLCNTGNAQNEPNATSDSVDRAEFSESAANGPISLH